MLTRFIFAENPPLALQPATPSAPATVTVDAQTVDQEWRAMTDVHQFFGLLKRYDLTRQQAFNWWATIWPVKSQIALWRSY